MVYPSLLSNRKVYPENKYCKLKNIVGPHFVCGNPYFTLSRAAWEIGKVG
jgi:hypothetical protein